MTRWPPPAGGRKDTTADLRTLVLDAGSAPMFREDSHAHIPSPRRSGDHARRLPGLRHRWARDRTRPADRSSGDDRRRARLRAPWPGRRWIPDWPEVGRHRRRRSGPAASWCATAPRANRARSRTAPCSAPTPTSSSKGSSSPRSPSAPSRSSSASSAASSARSTPSPAPCRSSSRPGSAPTARSRSSPDPTSTSSVRKRRCSR